MVLACGSLVAHSSKLFTRSKGLTAIIAISLCSILSLAWLLPGFSVRTKLERLLPAGSVPTEAQALWNTSSKRLVVFGDSWSDNGQYPIDPPPKDQMPGRDEARGKVWTEWLCSSVGRFHKRKNTRTNLFRFLALITTISQDRCLTHGIVVIVALLSTAIS